MKVAPIIEAINAKKSQNCEIDYRLIHTGQHYDKAMSGEFFEQLGIPEPDINLEVGSGTQAQQTASMLVRYEQVLMESPSDLCLVVGDVTSTLACSIAARKLGVPVAHVEGGIRSGDWSMPEEINRVVTDAITTWFFTTSETAGANLLRSGVDETHIFFVGNTMIDTLLKHAPRFRPPPIWDTLELTPGQYCVLTLHRPANVDSGRTLETMLRAILKGLSGIPVIFPVHPRTAKQLSEAFMPLPGLHLIDPLGYLEFNYLVKNAMGVITDSGGITEETTVMGIPCMTLRNNTERPETVSIGTNELIGTDPAKLPEPLQRLRERRWKKGKIPEKWDGHAAERIVTILGGILA